MHFDERNGTRATRAAIFVVGFSVVSALSVQAAENSGPKNPTDPFVAADPVPTPILPYASSVTEKNSASSSSGAASSPNTISHDSPSSVPLTELPTSKPIEAGPLTTISLPPAAGTTPQSPSATLMPPSETVVSKAEDLDKNKSNESSKKTTSVVRDRSRPATKNVAKTKTLPPAAPNRQESNESTQPTKETKSESPRPVSFNFPQPPIPLETMLRRWFGYRSTEPR